jgi:hypothetical protein
MTRIADLENNGVSPGQAKQMRALGPIIIGRVGGIVFVHDEEGLAETGLLELGVGLEPKVRIQKSRASHSVVGERKDRGGASAKRRAEGSEAIQMSALPRPETPEASEKYPAQPL